MYLLKLLGMKVLFHDIVPKLPIGNAVPVGSLKELLQKSDFVTLHVPQTPLTNQMITQRELAEIRAGGYLLNLSRGNVVDLPALKSALVDGHLAGAAVDVYPVEPKSNHEKFESELCGTSNLILTPHIGGSTQEAQFNIGREVAVSLVRFLELGSSTGAVNFPQVDLPMVEGAHRVLNIHRNKPGVLGELNHIVSDLGANITGQYLGTSEDIGYMITDVDKGLSREVKAKFDGLDASVKTRLLF